jgi:hypothetical protein
VQITFGRFHLRRFHIRITDVPFHLKKNLTSDGFEPTINHSFSDGNTIEPLHTWIKNGDQSEVNIIELLLSLWTQFKNLLYNNEIATLLNDPGIL